MAKRRKTSADAIASAVALIAEHHDVACVVLPGRNSRGESYTRWIPVGDRAAADALLESAVKRGMTAEEAENE
jgi:hypothetical protein